MSTNRSSYKHAFKYSVVGPDMSTDISTLCNSILITNMGTYFNTHCCPFMGPDMSTNRSSYKHAFK